MNIQLQKKLNKVFLHNLEEGLPIGLGKYDVIVAFHVIEHIAFPEKLLSDIKCLMDDESIFIMVLPNMMHYNFRFQFCIGNFEHQKNGVMDYTHLRWCTFKSAKNMLIDNGFVIIKAFVDGKLPLYRLTKYLPQELYKFIKRFLYYISKGFFAEQLLYIVKK